MEDEKRFQEVYFPITGCEAKASICDLTSKT